MTLTRWKLMAGVLGISIVGVALANPHCSGDDKKNPPREAAPPPVAKKEETLKPTPTALKLPDITQSPPAYAPAPLPGVSAVPSVALGEPTAKPGINLDAVGIPQATLPPPVDQVVELPLPGVKVEKPTLPVVDIKTEAPPALPPKTDPLLTPQPTPPALDIKFTEPPVVTPKAEAYKPELPKVEAKPAVKSAATESVRVVIHLGTGQPKFDVMAGEDVLLKAVCNNMDIRSPSQNGAGVTPLKAGGKVQFSAPGCEGTCDTLTVLPTTGEVELAGNVKVHCRMGKGETEINAATMKFKLGSALAYTVPEPAVVPVEARVKN